MQATTLRSRVTVTADGAGVVSHAGSRVLADLADATTLTSRFSSALEDLAAPQTAHDPGRVLTDLAVAIADGAECISDIAVLAGQDRRARAAGRTSGFRGASEAAHERVARSGRGGCGC